MTIYPLRNFNSEEPASVISSLPEVPSLEPSESHKPTTSCDFRLLSLALLILQRFFSRIPPQCSHIYLTLSPHRRFTGAYIIIAKKNIYIYTLPIQVIQHGSRLAGDIPSIMMDDCRARFTDFPSRHSRSEESSFTLCSLETALPFP
jgi:hypothetical protein